MSPPGRRHPVQQAPPVIEDRGTWLLTARDLLHMPEDDERYELVRGRLLRRSFGSFLAGRVSGHLARTIGGFVQAHELGTALLGAGFVFARDPDTVRAPSIAFVRAGRQPPDLDDYFPGAPDLAVDIDSGWDSFSYFSAKIEDYLAAGTPLIWVIDPVNRHALVVRRDGSGTLLHEDGILDGEDILPGFTLPLKEVWR